MTGQSSTIKHLNCHSRHSSRPFKEINNGVDNYLEGSLLTPYWSPTYFLANVEPDFNTVLQYKFHCETVKNRIQSERTSNKF
jgi:hypothetical protein